MSIKIQKDKKNAVILFLSYKPLKKSNPGLKKTTPPILSHATG